MKIVSDGTHYGTRVMSDNGELIEGVFELTITVHEDSLATVEMKVLNVKVELNLPDENVKTLKFDRAGYMKEREQRRKNAAK